MPVLNFTEVVRDLDGKPIKESPNPSPLLIGDLAIRCLLMADSQGDTGAKKLERFKLSQKIHDSKRSGLSYGEIDLNHSEIEVLNEVSGLFCTALSYGRMKEFLDGESSTSKDSPED